MRPKDVEVLFLRGSIRLSMGNYAEAKEDMDKVVETDGKNFERIIRIYEMMAAGGYKDSGQGYLTDALQTYENEMSYFEKGRMFFYMGEYKRAYLALEEAKNEGGVEAYLYLGKAYEATGDYNYAESVYNSYLAKVGEDARIYNQLGLCEARKGEYEAALSSFQAGLKMEEYTMKQVLLFNEIVAYEHLGEFEHAASLMQKYLQAYPDDAIAGREMDFLSTR
jgi:tetratricopeptide (TPR) repeat protein